jgi:Protein of unknown function (DUF2795)
VHCIAMILDEEYDDSSYNNKLQKEEQIPTEYNEEKTLRVIRKQNHIRGEGKRSKTINDLPLTAMLARALKDLEFPANKNEIVEFVQRKSNEASQILPVLDKIEERKYYNVADITLSTKLVEEY